MPAHAFCHCLLIPSASISLTLTPLPMLPPACLYGGTGRRTWPWAGRLRQGRQEEGGGGWTGTGGTCFMLIPSLPPTPPLPPCLPPYLPTPTPLHAHAFLHTLPMTFPTPTPLPHLPASCLLLLIGICTCLALNLPCTCVTCGQPASLLPCPCPACLFPFLSYISSLIVFHLSMAAGSMSISISVGADSVPAPCYLLYLLQLLFPGGTACPPW